MKIKRFLDKEYAEYVRINSTDGYSKGVVDFGERWATLMETAIEAGSTVAECAEKTSHEADTDGITGFMYGAAVSALVHFWEWGNPLQEWHNRQYLSEDKAKEADGTEKVVNPAIMTIGG